MIVKVDRIPKDGETVLGERFDIAAGGKGANQAVAAARAGGEVTFICSLGADDFGNKAMESFVKERIDVKHIVCHGQEASGVAFICVDRSGENSIAVVPGANSKLSPEHILAAEEAIALSDIVLVQLEIPMETVETAASLAARHQVTLVLNPAPAQALSSGLLHKVSILTPNGIEAEFLTGVGVGTEEEAEKAAKALVERGAGTALITMGPRGVFALGPETRALIDGFEVEAVDCTAAGDVFNGALAATLAQGKVLREAVLFANAAAALSVTKPGARPSIPRYTEITALLEAG
jgi:ribokinase